MIDLEKSELDEALRAPAVYANRFIVEFNSAGIKVVFLEKRAENSEVNFRSAVLVSYVDAVALKELLTTMLAPIEGQIASASQQRGN